jgi:acyltransferase
VVSGYTTNWESLRDLPGSALAKKYGTRLFIPWVVAILVYWLVIRGPLLPPYFHLWYISAYLSWLFLSRLLQRARLTIAIIFVISIFISVGGSLLSTHPDLFTNPPIRSFAHSLLATFRPDLYIFFVLGGCISHYKMRLPITVTALIAIIFLTDQILLYFYPHPDLSFLSGLLFPISVAFLLQTFFVKGARLTNPFLEWIGRNSLGIYLWHVLPILAVFRYLSDRPVLFYLGVIGLELLLFGFIWISSRIGFFRRYFYGML